MPRCIAARGPRTVTGSIVEQDLALNRVEPEERGEQLALSLALQTAQTEDLPAMQIEADVVEALAGAEVADREDDRRRQHLGDRRLGREDVLHLPADHELHQIGRSSCPAAGTVATYSPFLSTVMRSAIAKTSSSRWETKMIAVPASRKRRRAAKRSST